MSSFAHWPCEPLAELSAPESIPLPVLLDFILPVSLDFIEPLEELPWSVCELPEPLEPDEPPDLV
jgi:hypothetical protein